MELEESRWLVKYNKEKHELNLRNFYIRPINIGAMNIAVDEIKDIVRSMHIDHQ